MKLWEEFKSHLTEIALNGNMFYNSRILPKTDKERYWYNRGLHDTLMDAKKFENDCEVKYTTKYKSLIDCLAREGIYVAYDELTGRSRISYAKDLRKAID